MRQADYETALFALSAKKKAETFGLRSSYRSYRKKHTLFLVGIAFLVCFGIGQERTSHGVVAAFLGNESLVV